MTCLTQHEVERDTALLCMNSSQDCDELRLGSAGTMASQKGVGHDVYTRHPWDADLLFHSVPLMVMHAEMMRF